MIFLFLFIFQQYKACSVALLRTKVECYVGRIKENDEIMCGCVQKSEVKKTSLREDGTTHPEERTNR